MERGRDKNGGNASGPFPVLYCLLLMNPLFIHFGACSSGVVVAAISFLCPMEFSRLDPSDTKDRKGGKRDEVMQGI